MFLRVRLFGVQRMPLGTAQFEVMQTKQHFGLPLCMPNVLQPYIMREIPTGHLQETWMLLTAILDLAYEATQVASTSLPLMIEDSIGRFL